MLCKYDECGRDELARGYCGKHYQRVKTTTGFPDSEGSPPPACSASACLRPRFSKKFGLCRAHYRRTIEGNATDAPIQPKSKRVDADTDLGYLREVYPEGDPSACWEWPEQRRFPTGYGYVCRNSKTRGAHVVAWEVANGTSVPKGMVVRHDCDNRACVNPNHLRVGTQADNIDDMTSRGRNAKGAAINTARLTEPDVLEIRRRYSGGESQTSLGQEFGVTQGCISCIVRRKTWRHI